MKDQLKNSAQELIKGIPNDILGGILFGISVNMFTAPNKMAPGGITGLATLINYLTGIPIGTMSFIINVPLIIIAFKCLGFNFSIKTLKSSAIISFIVDLVGFAFKAMNITGYQGDKILAALMGGVLTGLALAVVFMSGSTTGGMDIISRLMKKKFPHKSIGRLTFISDFCVLALSVLVYGNIESGLYGLITIFTCSRMVDMVLYGGDKGKNMMIVTQHPKEIAQGIKDVVNRGVTLIHGEGSYTGTQKKVVMCALKDNQYPAVKRLVYSIDPQAFIIVNEATEILGTGFNPINQEK